MEIRIKKLLFILSPPLGEEIFGKQGKLFKPPFLNF